jgi:hypothetical protein
MSNLLGHIGMDGCSELDMAWTDVDLHGFVSLCLF